MTNILFSGPNKEISYHQGLANVFVCVYISSHIHEVLGKACIDQPITYFVGIGQCIERYMAPNANVIKFFRVREDMLQYP